MMTTQEYSQLQRITARTAASIAMIVAICVASACGPDTTPQPEYVPTPADQSPTAAPPTQTPQTPEPRPTTAPPTPTPQTSNPLPTATPDSPPAATQTPVPRVTAASVPNPERPNTSKDIGTRPPDRDLEELATRLRGVAPSDLSPAEAAPLTQGTQETFWITNLDDGSAHSITATLHVVSDNAYWFVEKDVEFDNQGLEEAARIFEASVRPAVVETFGDIRNPGIDGDPRLFVLHARLNGAAGYFGSADAYPPSVHPHSNEREIIYMDIGALHPGTDPYMAVIAHEFQHAIHFNHDNGEDSWVNEGLSELASEISGYELQSPRAFLVRPVTQLNFWADEPHDRYPHYGASALFMKYLAQRVGGHQNLTDLITQPLDGIEGVDSFLNDHGLTFVEVFADWVVANYLDADDERFGYPDRHFKVPSARMLRPGKVVEYTQPQFSARYYKIDTDSQSGVLTFQGDNSVRQVGADCLDEDICWWSGRGDSIDTTLTREFDLTGLNEATLEFMVWYEIEEGWDYAYIEASDDGGRTWHILDGRHTTTDNPSGNAYGPGYTGSSDGWLQESIDLTPFAGGPVIVRFEYVTDDAVYLDGLLIDDMAIPELNIDLGSNGDAWHSDGFRHSGNPLPQRFIVQIIQTASDGSLQVSRLELDSRNHAEMNLSGGDGTIVVVSPITPDTRHTASYKLEFRERP